MSYIKDANDPKVQKQELDSLRRVNLLLGNELICERNPDPYGRDGLVYRVVDMKDDDTILCRFVGSIEVEHAENADANGYRKFRVWSLLQKKIFVVRQIDGRFVITSKLRSDIDRCMYLKFSRDMKLSFVIPISKGYEKGHDSQRNYTTYYSGMKGHQQKYWDVPPFEFVYEDENVLTKKDRCVIFIREQFLHMPPYRPLLEKKLSSVLRTFEVHE